ncbi:beta-galactosidase [Paenibacillus sp. GCM10027626]|uniref:beta-galactosidase n=1 Tax=Paenibacillus sp. GCM10027626 TaxID=3273411 RepID=UPI00363FC9E2
MSKNIVVFYDPAFPFSGPRPQEQFLQQLSGSFTLADADGLAAALSGGEVSGYIHLHGSYFPKAAWNAILQHVRAGKGLLAAGGAPFKVPVSRIGASWVPEQPQTAYHQQLSIHEMLQIDCSEVARLRANSALPLMEEYEALFDIESTYGLAFHLTHAEDCPNEMGSGGPMDGHVYPLLNGLSGDSLQRELSAPAILLEHTKGDFSGGRWILINQQLAARFWAEKGLQALQQWGSFIAQGVTELWLKPNYAAYEPGERAVLMLQGQQIAAARDYTAASHSAASWSFRLRVLKADQAHSAAPDPTFTYRSGFTEVWHTEFELAIGRELTIQRFTMPVELEAGFYVIICEAVSDSGEKRILRQGIWGIDRELLQSGEPISCDRDYFRKEGRPLPIVGMTYMTSDVARKYLFLPNAAVWDRDMAQMKRAGINMIRTGIWTAYRHIMFVDGHPYEEVLRAIDAFFHTAKRYELEVTFNFFSFAPELWEGVNPYLDPRSVEAQKRFIAAVVSRHKDSSHVHWDLINEPSMFDPKRIFSGPRSCQDKFEHAHFIEWLRNRHGDITKLQQRWNMTPEQLPSFEAVKLPEPEQINFRTTEITEKKGGQWLDYTLFTMDMHNRWASQLTDTIRAIQPRQLVTVGQDEGLGAQRPSPFFYAEAVDYTTVHSWWKMDDLVWDGIFAKATEKPNLIQETGIMYVETPDGRAKRSEAELRNILERKYAYAFSTGGAGAVQWIWNINFYMNNINESHIGALRADGSEKPEADVSYDFGAFMAKTRDLFEDRELEDIAVIFPYSNDFSNRPLAGAATTKLTRTLAYEMNVHVRGLGEYHLDSLAHAVPKLIIVPSAHNFSSSALEQLMNHIYTNGGTLLFTGPVDLDEYWHPADRAQALFNVADTGLANVLREEMLQVDGQYYPVSFGGTRIADSCKQADLNSNEPARLYEQTHGAGKLLWCPLPIELNDKTEVLKAVYAQAMQLAEVSAELEWLEGGDLYGIYGRKMSFAQGSLFIFVSEYGCPASIKVRDPQNGKQYSFTLESERSLLFATDAEGQLIAVYRNLPVAVN